MDDRELGRRIAYWRERRGMTQQLFADRIGRSYSWVTKVETGARSADRLAILDRITEVLRIDTQVLLGKGLPRETQQCIDNPEVEAIRTALERYDAVAVTLHTASAQPPTSRCSSVSWTTCGKRSRAAITSSSDAHCRS